MNFNRGLLSICCLGYNHGKYITENIKNIWDSPYKNVEIIVVDDGSKDDSAAVLKKLQQSSPFPMIVILQENTGNIGHNFNVALKQAKGEFILFMSLDDVLISDQIKKCICLMNNNSNIAFIASSKVFAIDGFGNRINTVPDLELDKLDRPSITDLLDLEYNFFGAFYIQGAFFRKEIVDLVGGFDEDMTGDDIILRTKIFLYVLNNPELKFLIEKEPICRYRRHGNNVSNNGIRQIKIVTEYLQRYWSNRENPKILENWTFDVIKNMSFCDSLKVFSLNARSASLLNSPRLSKVLEKKVKEENLFLFKSIYYIEKIIKKSLKPLILFLKKGVLKGR